jgi:hypothetical protein
MDQDDVSGRAGRRAKQGGTYSAVEWSGSFLVEVSTSLGRLGGVQRGWLKAADVWFLTASLAGRTWNGNY